MGTITMSGFNKIDWSAILEAVMSQERQPLKTMETQKTELSSKSTAFGALATKLGRLQDAASALKSVSSFAGRTVTSSDPSILTATSSSTALVGAYDIVVNQVARAQVTTLGSSDPAGAPIGDRDTTVVATGGSLTFHGAEGDVTVTLEAGSYTLDQLASAINGTEDVPAQATVVQANGNFQLVLTATETGAANAFTLTNALQGGTVSWAAANAMAASDADIDINNVKVTSASNVIEDAIGGVTLSLLRDSGGQRVSVGVAEDASVTKTKVEAFITAYNDIVTFANTQSASARAGEKGSIGNDPMLRGLRNTLSHVLTQVYDVGGDYGYLSEIGLEFTRTGTLSLNASIFDDAMKTSRSEVERLLAGSSATPGAFSSITSAISDYTSAGGLVPDAKKRLEAQITSLGARISAMEERLAIRQASLLAEYTAADQLISSLNSQGSSLTSLVSSYSAF
jgi:flagellar hook-associated protein 2